MRAIDLYCGAGGATRGLVDAGFSVIGIDIEAQPNYLASGGGRFVRTDVLQLKPEELAKFDLIWASPPCQAHTVLRDMHNAKNHVDLIAPTRDLLRATGAPYVIENVVGAPLIDPVMLCGTMFGLKTADGAGELRRHRIFETNFPLLTPQCQHGQAPATIGVYGGHRRNRRRVRTTGNIEAGSKDFSAAAAYEAMGISWMSTTELSQAIPPAFSEWLGRAVKAILTQRNERYG